MKNIIKKSLSVVLVGGLVFASSMTVCATESLYSTENQEGYGLDIGDEVYTIDDSKSSNYGITADVTDKNIVSLETSKISEQKDFAGFKNDAIVEIYDIKVNYLSLENGEQVTKTTDDYGICDNILISIPCDNPNLYVLDVSDGSMNGDLSFNYKNGKYYFYPAGPGSFMLCTEPTWSVEVPHEFNMIEQTMVDPNTGITVSGVIPEDAMMYTTFENVHFNDLLENFDIPNMLKYDYPLPSLKEVFIKKLTDGEIKYDYSWYEEDFFADGPMVVDIVFVKDYEIIEFESDLTITLPLDYYKVLESKSDLYDFENHNFDDYEYEYTDEELADMKRKSDTFLVAKTFQLNPVTSNLKETEVLTKEGGTDSFAFKTGGKSTGTYFVGNEALIESILYIYNWTYKDIDTFDKYANAPTVATSPTSTTTTTTTTAQTTSTDSDVDLDVKIDSKLIIACIATNVIWLVVVIVLAVKLKKKKQSANADNEREQ